MLYGTLIEGAIYLKLPADDIAQYEIRFKESLARLKNLGEGRDTRDEMRYDSLRINVSWIKKIQKISQLKSLRARL